MSDTEIRVSSAPNDFEAQCLGIISKIKGLLRTIAQVGYDGALNNGKHYTITADGHLFIDGQEIKFDQLKLGLPYVSILQTMHIDLMIIDDFLFNDDH